MASLVRLTQQIHDRLEEERQHAEFENQKNQNIMTSIQHFDEKFFGSILQVYKDFLTPNILIIAKKEISESILYEATQVKLSLNLDILVSIYKHNLVLCQIMLMSILAKPKLTLT